MCDGDKIITHEKSRRQRSTIVGYDRCVKQKFKLWCIKRLKNFDKLKKKEYWNWSDEIENKKEIET